MWIHIGSITSKAEARRTSTSNSKSARHSIFFHFRFIISFLFSLVIGSASICVSFFCLRFFPVLSVIGSVSIFWSWFSCFQSFLLFLLFESDFLLVLSLQCFFSYKYQKTNNIYNVIDFWTIDLCLFLSLRNKKIIIKSLMQFLLDTKLIFLLKSRLVNGPTNQTVNWNLKQIIV